MATRVFKERNEATRTALQYNLNRIVNQTFKLLPTREEGEDWQKPLDTLLVEVTGMASLFQDDLPTLLTVACKMEGLKQLDGESDFILYRRTILEICNLLKKIDSTHL